MNRQREAFAEDAAKRTNYRADIDGLRAIAVLAVVAFHAVPLLAPGGFVGVDIFFVISGYLITGIIAREINAGSFSLVGFYKRRLRRIAPAFLVVCAFSTVGATLLYIPSDFELFGKSLIASILIHANIFFFHHAGYFAAPDEVMPLLHMWSLSVEEQFYAVFPFLLIVLARWKRWTKVSIAAVAGFSFVASCYAVSSDPDAAFYLGQYRAWELLVGCMLALGILPRVRGAVSDVSSLVGGGLIAASIWGLSSSSAFPGLAAAAPCLGAALVIHSGANAKLNRALSFRPVVGVGLISYSLYLWHWPLLSFGAYLALRPLSVAESLFVVLLSVAISIISYRYVEQPFRRPVGRIGIRPIFAGATLLLAFAAFADLSNGARWRLPAAVVAALEGDAVQIGVPSKNCDPKLLTQFDARLAPLLDGPEDGFVCRLGNSSARPTIVLWGDSHARAASPALDTALKKAGLAGYLLSRGACPPLIGVGRPDRAKARCEDFGADLLEFLGTMKPSAVILTARWAAYFEGTQYSILKGPGPRLSIDKNFQSLEQALDETLLRLRFVTPALYIVSSVPEIGYHVPSALARAAILDRRIDIAPTRLQFEARQHRAFEQLALLAKKHGAPVAQPDDYLCSPKECLVEQNGKALYADFDHLSVAGSALLVPMFSKLIETKTSFSHPAN